MRMFVLKYFILFLMIIGCEYKKTGIKQLDLGLIKDSRLNEVSGIEQSGLNEKTFWLHNDSGDSAQLFAINRKGNHLGRFKLTGIENRDWEDITVGPGPDTNQSYIYIGEIGDNDAIYNLKYIYRIKEPKINLDNIPYDKNILDVESITYRYPDGARDAEALLIDPLTRDIIVISKREESVRVYILPYPQSTESVITPNHIATLPITQITAGDISNSGTRIILKNYETVYSWKRKTSQSLTDIFMINPDHLPYIPEPQGEALCWSNDEKGYYTVSEEAENTEARLYYYPIN